MKPVGQFPAPAALGGIVSRRALFARLDAAPRVTAISAPAGSGKTFLLRSWITESGLVEETAWVTVQGVESDSQQFWIHVADALRGTAAGQNLVRELTAAPGLDGWAVVERLLKDLAPLGKRLLLGIDDLQELRSSEVLRQLELLVLRAPPQLRFVLATRGDLRLGLHRLRLEGELTEIRADDLRFTLDEACALFNSAGVDLSEPALASLYERTEGWAAGLRLAALSLAGQPDPDRFAAEFSGSERTVADYLLAEVLGRQSDEVKRLLLRTAVLDRINGDLADRLTGDAGAERILQDLEQAGAFVVSLDAARTWFRYHQMFADLLRLELRRTAPDEISGLHATAAGWYAEHGYPVEAIGHAQAAEDWGLAALLLSDHWVGLQLDGQAVTMQTLLAGFPADVIAADAELTALTAFGAIERGPLEEAEHRHALAAAMAESVPAGRREPLQLTLTVLRLSLARLRGDLPAALEEGERLHAARLAQDPARYGLSDELCALTLINLGIVESWLIRVDDADKHLEQGVAMARRTGRPYLEALGLANWAIVAQNETLPVAAERSTQAIELARRHGWVDEPVAAPASAALGMRMLWQGRLDEASSWIEQAERVVRNETDPVSALMMRYARGLLELARGNDKEALAAFRPAERLAKRVVPYHALAIKSRAFLLHAWTRLGDLQHVEQALARMDAREREAGETRIAVAVLRLAQADPAAAAAALVPVLDGSAPVMPPGVWMARPYLLEALARDALGDAAAAARALERAFDLAEPGGAMLPFLLHPEARRLLERHTAWGSSHRALLSQVLSLREGTSVTGGQPRPIALLSASETRVLRYMPTNLSAPEIAAELSLSVHTVRTHIRHVYEKLGVHDRTDAVERARALGMLAPASHRR